MFEIEGIKSAQHRTCKYYVKWVCHTCGRCMEENISYLKKPYHWFMAPFVCVFYKQNINNVRIIFSKLVVTVFIDKFFFYKQFLTNMCKKYEACKTIHDTYNKGNTM